MQKKGSKHQQHIIIWTKGGTEDGDVLFYNSYKPLLLKNQNVYVFFILCTHTGVSTSPTSTSVVKTAQANRLSFSSMSVACVVFNGQLPVYKDRETSKLVFE